MLVEDQPIHVNESEEEVVPVCENCRHQDTSLCDEYLRKKRYYTKKFGYKHAWQEKLYCKFWSYKPVGLWNNDVETYLQT